MHYVLVALTAAIQMTYEANVASFGCNSIEEVAELQSIRANDEAFQKVLVAKVVYGQCIVIDAGAVVHGVVEESDAKFIRIGRDLAPPGFMAPLADFKTKPATEKLD